MGQAVKAEGVKSGSIVEGRAELRLIVDDSAVLDWPDDTAVRDALRRLCDDQEDVSFVILVDGPDPEHSEYFIQTAGSGTDGFVLEYREGSWDQHYQCDTVSLGQRGCWELTNAFINYLHGNIDWKTRFKWELLSC